MARNTFKGSGKYGAHVGAHTKGSSPKKDTPYYTKNRSPMGQLQGKQVHRKATKKFSQYDTSAIQPKKSKAGIPIVIIAIVIVAFLAWWFIHPHFQNEKSDVVAGQQVEVTIPEGASTAAMAEQLYEADVIASERDFKNAAKAKGVDADLKPGTYQLVTLMDTDELLDTLAAGPGVYGTKLVVPEGTRIEDLAKTVESELGIPAADFIEQARTSSAYEADYPFVADAYDGSLEGYLFPKTYDVPDGANADQVIRMMLDQFETELAAAGLSTDGANGHSLAEIVTIASMIEGETSSPDELAKVASVIYNRLDQGMRLQIDATVVYALGDDYTGNGAVSYDDLEVDSPYNTYQNEGLPPGPINSPGIEAIKAAANPEQTDYLYYLMTGDDTHSFFVDYDEFLAAKEAQ
ncbi:MAG: endolytic transglycosylase MltG [Coriobacteriales bacterium]|jgi:UPF0755 protein